jgi:hypothetical protein
MAGLDRSPAVMIIGRRTNDAHRRIRECVAGDRLRAC